VSTEQPGRRIVLSIVIADECEPWDGKLPAQFAEQCELCVGRVLHVVPDELDEVGANQAIHLVDHPQGGLVIVQARLRQVKIARHDEGDWAIKFLHRWSPRIDAYFSCSVPRRIGKSQTAPPSKCRPTQ
jgi:hypothetical protein